MRATESVKFTDVDADTTQFELKGGRYQFALAAATFGGGNVVIEQLGADGTTWLPLHTALTAAGVVVFECPPGMFRANLTTATDVVGCVTRIPGE